MARSRVKLNRAGFKALLTGPEVVADIRGRAEQVAAAAGDGYEVLPQPVFRKRARAIVTTATYAARRREARDHRLLGALDAGRG